jgi:diadenosine tetraphosphate (Ap4A) HIT family hydrolase
MTGCELCDGAGGRVVVDEGRLRVVLVDDADHPGYIRVIWNRHAREMTDLAPAERDHLMRWVFAAEQALRIVLAPDKLNLASLGNMTPHLHWHVIPRFKDDAHFPGPVWAARRRDGDPAALAARRARLPDLEAALRATPVVPG